MKFRFFLLVLTLFLVFDNIFAQEKCKDVLEQAAYNKLNLSFNNGTTSLAKDWFCSDNFFSDIRNFSADGSISVPIEGVPVKFGAGGNSQESLTKRERFCQSRFKYFSSSQELLIFSQVVNKDTLDAWERCMNLKLRNEHTGIVLENNGNNSEVLIAAKFTIRDENSREIRPLILSYFCIGANDSGGEWQLGKEVPLNGIIHKFKRVDPCKEVKIILRTTIGISELTIPGESFPSEVGSLQVTWEEPYQSEGEPQQVWDSVRTGNHHCERDCAGEPTRTQYSIRLDGSNWGNGFLRNLSLQCIDGPCVFSQVHEVKSLNSKVGYARFDVWSREMTWRLSGEWVFYKTSWRQVIGKEINLEVGSIITYPVPKKARNIKIFGRTLEGKFNYTIDAIESNTWLKYNGFTETSDYWFLKFTVTKKC